jgi:hypothetical protein
MGLPQHYKVAAAAIAFASLSYLVIWLVSYVETPVHVWDGWSIWTRKAMILDQFRGLPRSFFVDPAYRFMHQDYPLLLPLLESVYFRAMGTVDTAAINAVFWLLLVGFLGALGFVASWNTRARIWVPVVLAVLLAPLVYFQLSTGHADVPMGFFLALGVLLLARWTSSTDTRELVLAAIFLTAAASVKEDALGAVLGALLVAGGLIAWERRPALLLRLIAAAAGVAAALAPWRIWVAVEGIPKPDVPIGQGLTPSYLSSRLDRVWPSVEALARQIPKQGGWLVPAAVVVVVVALRMRIARRVAVFYLLTAIFAFGSIVWSFCITRKPLDWQIATSASRVVVGVVFIAVAGLVHLGAELDRRRAAARAS